MDKGFGAVPSERLLHLATQLEESQQPQDIECAASAIIEATIFSPYRDQETVDNALFTLDYAAYLLDRASGGYWQELEIGQRHPDDQDDALRSEVKAAFVDVYRDIVAGEITEQTREETYAKLAKIGKSTYAHTIHAKLFRHHSVGLSYEIATLMAGLSDDTMLLVPSTPRAGSGRFNGKSTNDFSYLQLDESGYLKVNTPIELKGRGSPLGRMEAEGHYSPRHVVLLHARKDLGMTWQDIPEIFSHRSLTSDARRKLAPARAGIFNNVNTAVRRFTHEDIE
ncbi:MAG TPA: hypothetical protein VGP12_03455 [Nitrosospira sp.]|nr:hypothetical protein [Nitrosospira sp.]